MREKENANNACMATINPQLSWIRTQKMCSRRQTNDDLAGRRETNFYNITTLPILLGHHSLPKEMFAGKKPPQEMGKF